MNPKHFVSIVLITVVILLRCFSADRPNRYGPASPIENLNEIAGIWVLVESQYYTTGQTGSFNGYSYHKANLFPPEEVIIIQNDTLHRYDSIPGDTCYQYYFGLFDSTNSIICLYTKISDSLQYSSTEIGLRTDTLQFGDGETEYYYLRHSTAIPTNICDY